MELAGGEIIARLVWGKQLGWSANHFGLFECFGGIVRGVTLFDGIVEQDSEIGLEIVPGVSGQTDGLLVALFLLFLQELVPIVDARLELLDRDLIAELSAE